MFSKNNNGSFYLLLFTLVFFFSSCLTAKRMDRWIDKHYNGRIIEKGKGSDYISIKVRDSLGDQISTTQKTQSKMLPLLFYWQWHYAMASKITARAPFYNFTSSFVNYANSQGLKSKLNGRSVELTLTNNPANFSMHEKGYTIYFVFFYISNDMLYISPENQTFSVSYRILDGGQAVKQGVLSVPNLNKEVSLKLLQSTKKMVWKHLDKSDENMQQMSRQLVDELMRQLP